MILADFINNSGIPGTPWRGVRNCEDENAVAAWLKSIFGGGYGMSVPAYLDELHSSGVMITMEEKN